MLALLVKTNIILKTAAIDGQSRTLGTREYFFGTDLVNYAEAEQRCSQINFHLVAIYTEDIQNFLQDTINDLSHGKTNFVDLKLCCFNPILIELSATLKIVVSMQNTVKPLKLTYIITVNFDLY